jgi:GH24 family phage-related lysozyme (muramidase)
MTQQEWETDFAARLMHNEGFRLSMYHDSMGIPTIGCGFNLQRSDWRQGLAAAGVTDTNAQNGILDGTLALSVAEVGALLNYSDEPIIPQGRALLEPTHFDNMSDARRCAFADMCFNIGESGLGEFYGFLGLMNQACHYIQTGDPDHGHSYFAQAASDLLSTGYAQQVGARAQRNAAMISSSAYVAIDAFESS